MSEEKKRSRLTAIDVFIIFAVIAVAVAAGLRVYDNVRGKDISSSVTPEEYIVSFKCKEISESSAKLLEKGDTFYLSGSDDEFGILAENPTITPAKIRVELANGELKSDVYAEKNGDNTKVDVTGEFRVKGYKNSDGLTFAGEDTYIAPNVTLTVLRGDMLLKFTVTGVEKVS